MCDFLAAARHGQSVAYERWATDEKTECKLTCFFLDLAQDVEERGFHPVTVECVLPNDGNDRASRSEETQIEREEKEEKKKHT